MSISISSKAYPEAVQTADLHCALGSGTDALPIHPVKLIPPGRQDTPSTTAPSEGTIPSRSTNRELIDQITRRLLIYKYVSKVKTHAINTTKVREGAYQRTVTKVIRGIYVLMNGCETLINLFTTDTEEGLNPEKVTTSSLAKPT